LILAKSKKTSAVLPADPEAQHLVTRMSALRSRGALLSALAGALLVSTEAFGCGPFFPNTLLGDLAVLSAPQASFKHEIERMKLIRPSHLAVPTTNALETELSDLRMALDLTRLPVRTREGIIKRYQQEREKIKVVDGDSLRPTNAIRIPGLMPQ